MKNSAARLFSLLIAACMCATGCMENGMLLNLNKDGSGTLTYRVYMSQDVLDMMEGMASGMAAGLGEEAQEMPDIDPFEEMKTSLADQFGDAATLQSSRTVTNDTGWKGFEAVYAFEDVNQLNLDEVQKMDSGGGASMEQIGTPYRFEFTPGDVATLKMFPQLENGEQAADAGADGTEAGDDVPAADGDAAETDGGTGPDTGMQDMGLDQMGLAMMKPMLAGMRVSFLLAVNGEIVETNSRFRSEEHPNVVTLMDVSMDQVMEHPDAAELMEGGDEGAAKLAELDVPGIRIEDPSKEIVVSFK